MGFRIGQHTGKAGDRSGPVYLLSDADQSCRAEVWPFIGFNCLRWQVRNPSGEWGDLLYVAPDWHEDPVPTRSGHPILFPFPNRFREGRFTYHGKEFHIPLNDNTKRNAIHGYTARNPWWVLGSVYTQDEARITGLFRLSEFAPASAGLWPTDATLTVTYRLRRDSLRVDALVENPSPGPLPFGLGYHPYFRVPTVPDAIADEMILWTAAHAIWETEEGLPTGRKIPVSGEFDFRAPRPIGPTNLDNLFGELRPEPGDPLPLMATLGHRDGPGLLEVRADSSFEDLVLFTPAHRKAVAIEPYTCTTDAANLQDQGVASGWRELATGDRFHACVEYRWMGAKM